MKWVIIKGVRYPSSVISAFAAYNMDNPFLKVRIRNKYHIVPFDDVNKMASQMVYLMDNYPDFVQIGRWWISKKAVMSWVPKGQTVDGSGWGVMDVIYQIVSCYVRGVIRVNVIRMII